MPASAAAYQAIHLADMWMASLEHGNQVSSLTSEQSVLGPDGAYWYVIANEDPGHANWLDAGDLDRGVFLMRYDGVQGDIPRERHPTAELVAAEAGGWRLEVALRTVDAPGLSVRFELKKWWIFGKTGGIYYEKIFWQGSYCTPSWDIL